MQKVKVGLTQILSKEERITLYKANYPEYCKAIEDISFKTSLKGVDKESMEDIFGIELKGGR